MKGPHHIPEPAPHGTWADVPGWAAYLACSWTWCIGMFLPVLLVRDFGPWGFVVFAIPNVLGAAGMGWVLRRAGATERVLTRNLLACRSFSLVTVAFQWFFLGWMLSRWGPAGAAMGLVVVLVVLLSLRAARPVVVAGVSLLAVLLSASFAGMLGRLGELTLPPTLGRPGPDLIWLAPVCAFGFGLCPYLDVTFHRVRRMAPGPPGTAAFTLGFGVLFAAAIVFTLAYRELFVRAAPLGTWNDLTSQPGAILAAYLFMQLAFTSAVHLIEISAIGQALAERRGRRAKPQVLHGALMLSPLLLGYFGAWAPPREGLEFNEVCYRCFMAFYGLVFPAYVWLCMIPTTDGHSGVSREKLRVWAAAIGIAAPMFWMGFIQRQTWWLGPGMAVVLCARLLLPRNRAPGRRTVTSSGPAPRSAGTPA